MKKRLYLFFLAASLTVSMQAMEQETSADEVSEETQAPIPSLIRQLLAGRYVKTKQLFALIVGTLSLDGDTSDESEGFDYDGFITGVISCIRFDIIPLTRVNENRELFIRDIFDCKKLSRSLAEFLIKTREKFMRTADETPQKDDELQTIIAEFVTSLKAALNESKLKLLKEDKEISDKYREILKLLYAARIDELNSTKDFDVLPLLKKSFHAYVDAKNVQRHLDTLIRVGIQDKPTIDIVAMIVDCINFTPLLSPVKDANDGIVKNKGCRMLVCLLCQAAMDSSLAADALLSILGTHLIAVERRQAQKKGTQSPRSSSKNDNNTTE